MAQNKNADITLVVTGWDNVKVSNEDKNELVHAGVKLVELSGGNIEGAQPMAFTFPRVAKLADQVIEACKNSDYIIYDFFAIEGYIAGKQLGIPAVCSVPAIMGKFDPTCKMFKEGLERNGRYIADLENKYGLEIASNLEMVSDGFLLASEYQNIQWSWPKFIKVNNFSENRSVNSYQFMRPKKDVVKNESSLIAELNALKLKKKIIYISLGTVVTGNLWNAVPGTREFVRKIFNNIKDKFGNSDKYEVVVSTGRKVSDLFESIPTNFHVYESVPQPEVLALADVFLTHGGGNSVNEAIDAETPMVVIPFFGDQHVCADNVAKLGIGVALKADETLRESVVDTNSCHLERKSMNDEDVIINAIEIISSNNIIRNNFVKLKSDKPMQMDSFVKQLQNDKVLNWQEGDLLYGCNDDRKKLAALTGRSDFYRLCDMRSFSRLFSDQKNHDSMPRIIDQYHDVLTNKVDTSSELKSGKFNLYRNILAEYGCFIQPYLDKLEKLNGDHNKEKRDGVIWDMCLAGLEFFICRKQKTVHFVVGRYNDQINLATKRELAWVRAHWCDAAVQQHVKFYMIQDGKLIQADPEKFNWFAERPTPTLADVSPDKLDQSVWKDAMHLIKARRPHLFFSHHLERYQEKLTTLEAKAPSPADVSICPSL